MKKIFLLSATLLSAVLFAQKPNEVVATAPANWFNLSHQIDGIYGIGTERTYNELVKGMKADTVIVAVIDGGVDYLHEDLKDVMWHNPKEIPGNNIDDDKNGYVDDIYGWNFIGGANGKNVHYDNLELTRLYRPLYRKYHGRDEASVAPSEKEEYQRYLGYKTAYDKDVAQYNQYLQIYTYLKGYIRDIGRQQKKDTANFSDFKAFQPGPSYQAFHAVQVKSITTEESWVEFVKSVREGYEEISAHLDYQMNMDYDPREIVGDNYENSNEHFYGNPDVKGPDALHGTHVAGIIAANRMNGIGILGVNTAVRIMAVRVVPAGDERDKDVANGIRYAVDNGAKIINMSFGKAYSYDKGIVDEAVKYAEAHGVLLVHAAGNDNKDNDHGNNFPSARYLNGGEATNWIEIGALSWKPGKEQVAPFSNYGQTRVDIFAPGVDIKSCESNGAYIDESGTSMASPVTAGACAMLKVYYPNLTPQQIKEIIMKSADVSLKKKKVVKPGEKKKKIKFGKLSVSGGTVDLYAAMQLAKTYK